MKDYFIRLFNYDSYANHLILNAITVSGEPEKPVELMAHLLSSQQVWLNRLKGIPPPGNALWPDWKTGTFEKLIDNNHDNWILFLQGLTPRHFDEVIHYKTLKGDDYQNRLMDILAHVINHGTHHRAQAGQHLKLAGLENLPATDYIFYLRK